MEKNLFKLFPMRKPNQAVQFLLLILFALPLSAFAQGGGFSYQAVARDNSGNPMANESVNLTFTIRKGADNGAIQFEENHTASTNDYGLFSVVIGDGTNVSGSLDGITWGNDDYFLQVEVNGGSVSNEPLQSVPYAKVATNMALNDLEDVNASGAASGDVLSWNGSNWAATSGGGGGAWSISGTTTTNTTSGRVLVNRTNTVTGNEYFGFTTPTSGTAYGGMYINTDSDEGRPFYGYATGGSSRAWTYWDGSDSIWKVYNSGVQLSLTQAGHMGIGTADPTNTLELIHDVGTGTNTLGNGLKIHHISSFGDHYWDLYVVSGGDMRLLADGNLVGTFNSATGAYTTSSDLRLKTEVEPYGDVLPNLMKLQPKTYRYTRTGAAGRRALGFVAQEVEPLFPHLVYDNQEGNDPETLLTLDYAGFSVVAIKAIQEQQAVIEQQNEAMAEMNARIEALEAMVAELARD